MRRLVCSIRAWIARPLIFQLVYSFASRAGIEPNEAARWAVQSIQDIYMSNYGDETLEALEEVLCNEFGIVVEVTDFGGLAAKIADADEPEGG